MKGGRGRNVLEYVTGEENFRNEASDVISRAHFKIRKRFDLSDGAERRPFVL